MHNFWTKRLPSLGEAEAYDYIKNSLRDDDDYYARGGNGSGRGSSSSSYHADKESKLAALACTLDLLLDFFQEIGVDYRQFLNSTYPRK